MNCKFRHLWMDMAGEQLSRAWLLRFGILVTAVCVSVHVYLEKGWQRIPAPLALKHHTQSGHLDEDGRAMQVSAEVKEQHRRFKMRVSYVRNLKREGPAGKRDQDREDHSPPCSPHLHSQRKTHRWHIELQPWASESHSLEDEARRFLNYITTPQVSCTSLTGDDVVQEGKKGSWAACLDPKYSLTHKIQNKHCRVYSFGLDTDDRLLEHIMAKSGCEVHNFDPSLKQAHLQQADMWFHRLSMDWRDPNPVIAHRQHTTNKKLATILNDYGHREVDVLKADMESAEWKILENLILEGVLSSIGQLLLELHLHWAGFEVGGDDPTVVRFWFSLLKELECADFRLFHVNSDQVKPHLFLHKNILNASSTYTLGWVNTQWKP